MPKDHAELELTIVYTPAENGWTTAEVPALPGAITAGRTRDQARRYALDAVRLLLATPPAREFAGADVERLKVRLEPTRSIGRGLDR